MSEHLVIWKARHECQLSKRHHNGSINAVHAGFPVLKMNHRRAAVCLVTQADADGRTGVRGCSSNVAFSAQPPCLCFETEQKGNHCPDSQHDSFLLLVFEVHINGIMQYSIVLIDHNSSVDGHLDSFQLWD